MSFDPASLRQSWPAPSHPRPIVTIGAGSIVVDAHFPAYRKAGFPIAGVYDLDASRAKSVADKFGVAKVFGSLDEAVATEGAIFDLATPPGAHTSVLERIPVGSGVLIQKPMGADLDQATEILKVCRDRKLAAAVNFQLRFAPMMLAVRDALDRGLLGWLVDVEVHLAIDTPWGLFAFLKGLPRVEIAVHSIHYLDLIRGFLGDPRRRAREDDRPSVFRHGADPYDGDSRLWRRGPLGDVDQPQPRLRPQTSGRRVPFRRDWRARRTPSSGFSSTILAANRTNCGFAPRARRNGPKFLCGARGFPTLSSAEWRTCSVSAPARTPC